MRTRKREKARRSCNKEMDMKPRILSVKEKFLEEREPPNEKQFRFIETVGMKMPVETVGQNEKKIATPSFSLPIQKKQDSLFSKIKRFFRF